MIHVPSTALRAAAASAALAGIIWSAPASALVLTPSLVSPVVAAKAPASEEVRYRGGGYGYRGAYRGGGHGYGRGYGYRRGYGGAGIGLGLAGGLLLGGALAATAAPAYGYYGGPGYYDEAPRYVPVTSCYTQARRVFDGYGYRLQHVRVCDN